LQLVFRLIRPLRSHAGGELFCLQEAEIPSREPRTSRARLLDTSIGQTISSHCLDRKSTRLNSSHVSISYAVFCLKKKIKTKLNLVKANSIFLKISNSHHISLLHFLILSQLFIRHFLITF